MLNRKRWIFGGVLILAFLVSLGSWDCEFEFRTQSMGTLVTVKAIKPWYMPDFMLREAIEGRLVALNALFSTYEEDTVVMAVNRAKSGVSVPLPEAVTYVLSRALDVAAASEGLYDPTIQPLLELWNIGGGNVSPPSKSEIQQVLATVGYEKLKLEGNTVEKSVSGLEIDLSSLAKGYAVDDILLSLHEDYGINNIFVNIGGDLRSMGTRSDGRAWTVGIQDPRKPGELLEVLEQGAWAAMASSGDYMQYFEHDGRRYSHILNPNTGEPVQSAVMAATVLAPDCMTADALATVAMLVSPEKSMDMVATYGAAVFLMIATDTGLQVLKSENWPLGRSSGLTE